MLKQKLCACLFLMFIVSLGAMSGLLPLGSAQEGSDEGKYGKSGKAETVRADQAVKLTVENQSGKNVVFVSWRHYGPQYYYYVSLEDGKSATVDNFAAEWRVNGVWDQNGKSTPGWGRAYHFKKNTTIKIQKNKIDIN